MIERRSAGLGASDLPLRINHNLIAINRPG
jgi:hypothetical protein